MQSVHALSSAVESQAAASGGALGLGTFLRTVLSTVKSFGVQLIDTEAERDALIEKALALADLYVAPKFPVGWSFVRSAVQSFLDESLDNLPALLA